MAENEEAAAVNSESKEYVQLTLSEQNTTVELIVPTEEEEADTKESENTDHKEQTQDDVEGTGLSTIEESSTTENKPEESAEGQLEDKIIEEEVEEVEEVEEEKKYDREELVRKYTEALAERENLTSRNNSAQNKIAEYLRKKKNEEQSAAASSAEIERPSADHDQTYSKAMVQMYQLKERNEGERQHYRMIIDEIKVLMKEKELMAQLESKKASDYKRNVSSCSVFERTGRQITSDVLAALEANDKRKEEEVSTIRLENIKLKNQLGKLEANLRDKEQLAEGLHLIDFEQLKIENQTYNEKIEERNEELLKLRKKITDTVQVLTHLKEKMQFIQVENAGTKEALLSVEAKVARKRDVINHTKQARDALRFSNNKLQQKSGLLGQFDLLLDYEESEEIQSEILQRIEVLKRQHAELSLNIKGVQQKIKLAQK